jgi:hypothetical protein
VVLVVLPIIAFEPFEGDPREYVFLALIPQGQQEQLAISVGAQSVADANRRA